MFPSYLFVDLALATCVTPLEVVPDLATTRRADVVAGTPDLAVVVDVALRAVFVVVLVLRGETFLVVVDVLPEDAARAVLAEVVPDVVALLADEVVEALLGTTFLVVVLFVVLVRVKTFIGALD